MAAGRHGGWDGSGGFAAAPPARQIDGEDEQREGDGEPEDQRVEALGRLHHIHQVFLRGGARRFFIMMSIVLLLSIWSKDV